MNSRCIVCAVLVGAAAASGVARQAGTEPPGTPPPTVPPAAPGVPTVLALDRLSWLGGTWTGAMGEDYVEETWSRPSGDSIIGMFRWQTSDGKTTLWELLAIRMEGGDPVLRLRHFDAALEPWKSEAGGVAPMKATTLDGRRVVFTNATGVGGLASVEYACPAPDELKIVVVFKDESRETLRFALRRGR